MEIPALIASVFLLYLIGYFAGKMKGSGYSCPCSEEQVSNKRHGEWFTSSL